ncbi:MAG: hypothetical protein V1742_05775 [Pseudomonadota bacterium]
MFRKLFLIVTVLLMLPAVVRAEPLMVISEPKITLKEPVLEGATAQAEFIILNKGDSDLVITKIAPG